MKYVARNVITNIARRTVTTCYNDSKTTSNLINSPDAPVVFSCQLVDYEEMSKYSAETLSEAPVAATLEFFKNGEFRFTTHVGENSLTFSIHCNNHILLPILEVLELWLQRRMWTFQ